MSEPTAMTSDKERQRAEIRMIEDRLLRKSMFVMESAVSFQEIDPERPDVIPTEWIDELGLEGATQRHRVAMEAWKNQREAAVGLKVATNTAAAIIKARATEKAADRPLNIGVIMMAPMRQYTKLEVDE